MNYQINLSKARVYVGTYGKYAGGSIHGDWLQLSDYTDEDEFYEACQRIHDDEDEPEFMFQDYENIPAGLITENWISERIFEVIEAIEDMKESKKKPFLIWCCNGHRSLSQEDIHDLIGDFEIDYIGEYDSEEDFARELIDERDDLTAFTREYFDYEAYAYDLFRGEYWSEDGYVFYSS